LHFSNKIVSCLENCLREHCVYPTFVTDLALRRLISKAHHLVSLILAKLLAQVGDDVAQLDGSNSASAILVKDLESLNQLSLRLPGPLDFRDDGQKVDKL
jgi:hypothetical protein